MIGSEQTVQSDVVITTQRVKNTRTLVGKVVSDKRDKTVTVLIERRTKHELYGKIVAKTSKYHAHDESDQYALGDVVKLLKAGQFQKRNRGL